MSVKHLLFVPREISLVSLVVPETGGTPAATFPSLTLLVSSVL